VACLGDRVYVPVHGELNGVVCLQDDPQSRDGPVELWRAASPLGVYLSPAVTTGAVFFVDGRPGDSGRRLRAVDTQLGLTRWELPVASEASGEFVLWEEGGLIADRGESLSCFDLAGTVVWRADVGHVYGVPAVDDTMMVVATRDPAALAALDRATGRILWQIPLERAPTSGPVLHKATVFLGRQQGVAAFRLLDGGLLWETGGGPPAGPLAWRKGRLAYVRIPAKKGGEENSEEANHGGGILPAGLAENLPEFAEAGTAGAELVLVDADSGKTERTFSGVLPHVPPLLSRDAILVAGGTGLIQCSAATGKTQLWMRTSWLGPVTSPAVMANSRVYFGTKDRGLVCAIEKRTR
jgi:outer membrane protein assembly factor BamB